MIQDYSVRNEFSILNAKKFIDSVGLGHMYVFLGKTYPWNDESDPPTPVSSEQEMINAWDNMIIAKRLSSANLSLAVSKNILSSGTIYLPWDS